MSRQEALINVIPEEQANTYYHLYKGDARKLDYLGDESVHLIVTSPPYWNLKEYNDAAGQMGRIDDYEDFLSELNKVWKHCARLLVPGGRLVVVVGDVAVSRKAYGRHLVFPLHADIQVQCRKLGLDNLNPIIWNKFSNINYAEREGMGGGFLGKPYQPNAIIKSDIEFILMQRKPGGYRSTTAAQREHSMISKEDFGEWFRQTWAIPGARTKEHPAPYPLKLAERLVRMFSFVGDVVLDPFSGTGTTVTAAARWHRSGIGIEVDDEYIALAADRFTRDAPASKLSLRDAPNAA